MEWTQEGDSRDVMPPNDLLDFFRTKKNFGRVVRNAPDSNFGFPFIFNFPMEDLTNLKNKQSSLTWMAAVKKNKPGWKLFIVMDVSDLLPQSAWSGRSQSLT